MYMYRYMYMHMCMYILHIFVTTGNNVAQSSADVKIVGLK